MTNTSLENTAMTPSNNQSKFSLNTIEEAIEEFRSGKIVIVVDDEDRENEGDFVCAAECITPDIVNFMAMHGRGLICAPIEESRADKLGLNMMVPDNTSLHETAFTVSIDLIGQGCTTGISAYDRATAIKALVNPDTKPEDFGKPGHVFPLRAKTGGVLRRTGHTEASIDLARMAGFQPVGVLVEILNEDGTMARLPQLMKIAKRFELKIITIKDLVAYRLLKESLIKREFTMPFKNRFGEFQLIAYTQIPSGDTHMAIIKGLWRPEEPVLVRVDSSIAGSDLLQIIMGDQAQRIDKALEKIGQEGKGALLIMRQGRNEVSLLSCLKNLKNKKEAAPSMPVGRRREMEQRDFGIGAQILRDIGLSKIKLLTSSDTRRIGMVGFGLEVVEFVNW